MFNDYVEISFYVLIANTFILLFISMYDEVRSLYHDNQYSNKISVLDCCLPTIVVY